MHAKNITELKQINNIINILERMIDDINKHYKAAVVILETKELSLLSRLDFKILIAFEHISTLVVIMIILY